MKSNERSLRLLMLFTLTLGLLTTLTVCNVEKIIFTAPQSIKLPNDASIDNLLLIPLNPRHPSVRTHLNATFPEAQRDKGSESWFLLEGLNPGQRYEVRICWLATQPTAFWIYTHSLATTFETPELISSLTSFAYARHSSLTEEQKQYLQTRKLNIDHLSSRSSLLLLQVRAAADYFSLNEALMNSVPPVLVDVILDPYLFNVFPQSLVPTALYITGIAIVAWVLAMRLAAYLRQLSASDRTDDKTPRSLSENKKSE